MPETAPVRSQELHLRDYLRPIYERKWLIVIVVLLVTGGTYAYYGRQPRIYQASTKIFVGSPGTVVDTAAPPISDRTVQDQATLLVSRQVADVVAGRLGRPGSGAALASSVSASASPSSDFILITTRRGSAKDAAAVANGFAQAFIEIRGQQQRAQVTMALRETRAQLAALPPGTASEASRAALNDTIHRLELTLAVPSGGASQLDLAQAPGAPVAPRPARNAIFAFALSLLAALGAVFGLERFDRRLRRIEDVGPAYGLPTLAILPHSDEVAFNRDGRAALGPTLRESFRQLHTSIQLAGLDRPIKRILVVSAVAGEGKSTVVRNLAIVLREWGHRVAMVDADLRRPSLNRLFGHESEHGLTDVVTGAARLQDAFVRIPVHAAGLVTAEKVTAPGTASSNGTSPPGTISLLASGPLPANPQAVLAADGTTSVLREIAAEHDMVLIDAPPLLVVSDAVSLVAEVDAVIVIARLGLTTRDDARALVALLARIPGAHPVGVLVNDVAAFEGQGYGYGYRYGDGAEPT